MNISGMAFLRKVSHIKFTKLQKMGLLPNDKVKPPDLLPPVYEQMVTEAERRGLLAKPEVDPKDKLFIDHNEITGGRILEL